MKVKFELCEKVGFFIQPQTDFEAELISRVFQRNRGVDGFVKCGATPADVLGLRVYSAWWDRASSAKGENKFNNTDSDAIALIIETMHKFRSANGSWEFYNWFNNNIGRFNKLFAHPAHIS